MSLLSRVQDSIRDVLLENVSNCFVSTHLRNSLGFLPADGAKCNCKQTLAAAPATNSEIAVLLPTALFAASLVLSRAKRASGSERCTTPPEGHLHVPGVLSVYSARAERAGRPSQLDLSESHPACAARHFNLVD